MLIGWFIVTFLIGLAVGYDASRLRHRQLTGFEIINNRRRTAKDESKSAILDYIERFGSISNQEVEKLLDVSRPTATNYLQELKHERKVVQHGQVGRGVNYTAR